MKNKDFVVFILSHGRPDNVVTYKTLRYLGYTGKVYFVLDNEDKTIAKYVENFGKHRIFVFNKKAMADKIDEGNNFDNRKVIVHARNVCFDIARKLGVTYFMQLDDDYREFKFRINDKQEYPSGRFLIRTLLDKVFDSLLDFYKKIPAKSIALSQGGDWIGGSESPFAKYPLKRKAMNSFICSVDREFQFIGSVNEDVNTYVTLGSRGDIFFTIPFVALDQMQTQAQGDGMTEFYKTFGTYVKSFSSVLMQPSSVKVSMMSTKFKRLHHLIDWSKATPMIIDEKHKKETNEK